MSFIKSKTVLGDSSLVTDDHPTNEKQAKIRFAEDSSKHKKRVTFSSEDQNLG